MDRSIFLARVMSLFLIILSTSLIVNIRAYTYGLTILFQNVALQFIMGTILLIIGSMLVVSHNIWQARWTVVITILSWLIFLKAIFYLVFPVYIQSISQLFLFSDTWLYGGFLVNLVIGLYLFYQGFLRREY